MARDREELTAELVDLLRIRQNFEDEFDDAAAARLGVNRTDMRCLDILEREGPMTAGRLAELAGLTTGGITAVLDHLERAGYARRVRDPDDRRRVMVELDMEEMGKGGAEEIWGPLGEEAREMIGKLTDSELATVTDFVRAGLELNRKHLERIKALPPAGISESPRRLRGLLALAREVPDHVGLGYALAPRRLDDVLPGELGVGKVVPARQLHRLERAAQRRAEVLLRTEHRPQDLELLIGKPHDPHGRPSLVVAGTLGTPADGNGPRRAAQPASRSLAPGGAGIARCSPVTVRIRTATIRLSRTDSTRIS